LLAEAIIVVIAVGGLYTVYGAVETITHFIVLIARAVVTIEAIGDGFSEQAIAIVVAVVGGSATGVDDLCTATTGIKCVLEVSERGRAIERGLLDETI